MIGSVNQKRKNQALIACLRVEEYHRYMRIFTDIEAEMCPPSWKNERPLAKGEPLPLEVFPLIDDFEIVLEQIRGTSWGYHLAFFSEKRGYIASFPWWDHVELDLYRPSFIIPSGDFEQEWAIEIFPDDEYMYVLESNFDDPEAGYQRWFRVGKQHYLKEWQAAIEASHQIVYQSNLEYNEQKNKR